MIRNTNEAGIAIPLGLVSNSIFIKLNISLMSKSDLR